MNLLSPIIRTILRMEPPGKSRPDFRRFRRAITSNAPGPVVIGDIFADFETVGAFLHEPVLDWVSLAENPAANITPRTLKLGYDYISQSIRFCALNGWDYVYSFSPIPFKGVPVKVNRNTSTEVKNGKRGWTDDTAGPIMTWDDFENFKWPANIFAINLMTRIACRRVPRGMKVMVIPGGIFEWTTWLMGLTPFCYALSDNPALVDAVISKVSALIYSVVEDLMDEPNIGGVFMGDDLGFNTGTIVSPAVLRKKFLPQTKKIVDLAHSANKLFVLHSCGNMYAVMDDIIAMGIDAKHSYEDKILPVEEAHKKWGAKIAIIGGPDMTTMTTATPSEVKTRTREILTACAPAARFVLSTGNSVANYIPLKNYRAMIEEARKWNMENFGRS